MFDEVSHCRGSVSEVERRVKNARSRISEHERRKKPCEKCLEAKKVGDLGCGYYHDQWSKLHDLEGELSRARRSLREAQDRAKCFITDMGEPLDLVSPTTGEELHLGRYAFWKWDPGTLRHNVEEVSDDLHELKKKHGRCLRVFSVPTD